ncbi:unknown protein [Desulfotalea psychrophila LSv54]|uniref:Uncharacterized protein n=1 Tax=Desulfotalea psychrophila (strain LSv54 / DSM 12343) TaxID=177439 RepID=Q6AJ04_DESPS|nr:unknown protein [Desulfotalea psychrophila LSv54]
MINFNEMGNVRLINVNYEPFDINSRLREVLTFSQSAIIVNSKNGSLIHLFLW